METLSTWDVVKCTPVPELLLIALRQTDSTAIHSALFMQISGALSLIVR